MGSKRVCGICGRLYKVGKKRVGIDEWSIITDTSYVQVKVREPDRDEFFGKDICVNCARKIFRYVMQLKKEALRKCDFCEHHHGPKHPEYRKVCENCDVYSDFELKKRMNQIEKYRWDWYNGEVD